MALNLSQLPPPTVIQDVDYDALLQFIVDDFTARQPEYLGIIESDPAYSIQEVMAYVVDFILERVNEAARAVLVTHATGADLDNLGALLTLLRNVSESDDTFRVRIANRLETIVPGSLEWYRNYATQVVSTEIQGVDNVINNIETPITVKVKDALPINTPNPLYDPTQPLSESNLTEIPGSVTIYIQTNTWTHPQTQVITQVVPSSTMLQAVKNYLNAMGTNEVNPQREREAQLRRFLCDTVLVFPAEIYPYVICAQVVVPRGLDEDDVLRRLQDQTRAFAEENEQIGHRIPLSQFYNIINTDEVSEIQLMLPSVDVEPKSNAVPIALAEVTLETQGYVDYTDSATFAAQTAPVWSIGVESTDTYIFFKLEAASTDFGHLNRIRNGRRIGIFAQDDDGNPLSIAAQTLRATGEIEAVGNTHHRIPVTSITPAMRNGENYTLRILDSLEIFV